MDSRKEAQPKGDFECQLCGLTAPYSYYGQKPPNTHSVVLLEESYVMKDPFVPDKDKFLILGSQCSLCNRRVCVGTHAITEHIRMDIHRKVCGLEAIASLMPHDDFCKQINLQWNISADTYKTAATFHSNFQ